MIGPGSGAAVGFFWHGAEPPSGGLQAGAAASCSDAEWSVREPQPWLTTRARTRRFLQTRRAEVAQAYVQGDAAPLRDMATAHDPASFLGPGGSVVHGAMRVSEAHAEGAKSFGAGGSTRLEVLHHCASEGLAF